MTGITLPSVTMTEARASGGGQVLKYPYRETRLNLIRNVARVLSFLVPPVLLQSLPVFVYLIRLPAMVNKQIDRHDRVLGPCSEVTPPRLRVHVGISGGPGSEWEGT
jgi:hypothetical protein